MSDGWAGSLSACTSAGHSWVESLSSSLSTERSVDILNIAFSFKLEDDDSSHTASIMYGTRLSGEAVQVYVGLDVLNLVEQVVRSSL
jgi:hypothetical protein